MSLPLSPKTPSENSRAQRQQDNFKQLHLKTISCYPCFSLHSLPNQLHGPPAPLLAQKDAHFTLWIRAEGLHTRHKHTNAAVTTTLFDYSQMSHVILTRTHTHTIYKHGTIHTPSAGSPSFCSSMNGEPWKSIAADMFTKSFYFSVLPLGILGLSANEDTVALVCSLFLHSSFYKARRRESESSLRMHRSQLSPVSTLLAQQPIPPRHHEYFISSARRL